MNIYVIGSSHQAEEIKNKVNPDHNVLLVDTYDATDTNSEDVVFDFTIDDSPDDLEPYSGLTNLVLFINSSRISLAELTIYVDYELPNLFGMAADTTFLERPVMEICSHSRNRVDADATFAMAGLDAVLVDDRVGLVTPRIISMIINEAYYAVMDGTATREDVDTAMKLGTNYPMGPFLWAEKWGIAKVFELLEALYLDTKDERYKICPLMKQEYYKAD